MKLTSLPASAKPKWIGLIPALSLKLVGYESNKSFYVRVCGETQEVFQSKGEHAFHNPINNDLVVQAFKFLGYDVGYMNQFDRVPHHEFIQHLLNNVAFQQGLTSKNDWLFETL